MANDTDIKVKDFLNTVPMTLRQTVIKVETLNKKIADQLPHLTITDNEILHSCLVVGQIPGEDHVVLRHQVTHQLYKMHIEGYIPWLAIQKGLEREANHVVERAVKDARHTIPQLFTV